jgi:O-antigen/teichoic acid export membrane protein
VLGAGAAGVATYAFQVIGTRALGTEAYAPISVLWTIQYLVFAVGMVAVEAYVTRATTLHPETLGRDVRTVAAWLGAGAVIVGGITWWLRADLFGGLDDLSLTAALIVLAFGSYAVVRGRLAGTERFRTYGIVTFSEAAIRVVLALGVVALGATTRSLSWVLPLGPLLVAAWWVSVGRRGVADSDAAAEQIGTTSGFLAATSSANAAAQVLLAGGPLVLLPLGAGAVEVSIFFVTITAARTPVSLALGGILGRILPPLTRMAQAGEAASLSRVVVRVSGLTVLLAGAGMLAAVVVGDDLVAIFFGEQFRPDHVFVMLAAGGVVFATGGLLLNQILVATHGERRMPAPWIAALVVAAIVIVVLPGSPTHRVATAFLAGEVVALAALTLAALRSTRAVGAVARDHRENAPTGGAFSQ